MLAVPSGATTYLALRGPFSRLLYHVLGGPFTGSRGLQQFWEYVWFPLKPLTIIGLVLIAGFSISALFLPYHEVTQRPGRFHWTIEFFVPGTAPQWRYWGGLVLCAFIYGLLECALWLGTWDLGFEVRPYSLFPYSLPPVVELP